MQRKPLLCALALLTILLSFMVVAAPASLALAHSTHSIVRIEAPTPDVNAIATQAADAASDAERTSAEAQSTLNVVNFIMAFFALLFTLATLVGGALATYGFNTIRMYRKQLSADQEEVARRKADIDHTLTALVYLGLGDRLFNQKRTKEAIEIYRKVGSLLPKNGQINYNLGRIYSGAGFYEDAIKSFNTALSAEPDFAETHMELGLAYRRHGDAQKGPDAEALRNADYDQAIEHLKRAIDLRSSYEDALAALGAVYRRMGDRERDLQHDEKAREYYALAMDYYQQAHNAEPFSSYALGNVASLSWYLGGQVDKKAARSYFVLAEAAARVRIMNGGRTAEIYWDYFDLALAQLVIGTVDKNEATKNEALQTYKTAIQLTPGTVQFDSVLNNLYLLKKAPERIDKLDSVITMLETAKAK